MSLRVNNNVAAINAYRNLSVTDGQMAKSLEKLSSGFRINRAGDDAAGLVISENLRSQVGGLNTAVRNAQDGISVVQTAEGALTEVHSMLQRMRDLTVQAGNGSNSTESVAASQAEVDQLSKAINDISGRTSFNGKDLLKGDGTGTAGTPAVAAVAAVAASDGPDGINGTADDVAAVAAVAAAPAVAGTAGADSTLTFQVGANAGETLDVKLKDTSTAALGLDGLVLGAAGTSASLTAIDAAIKTVSTFRGDLGATQNRLEHTINNLNVTSENLTASESRIRDTDMAKEMTNFTRSQILTQAGTAMLAQANSAPQQVLQLLRG